MTRSFRRSITPNMVVDASNTPAPPASRSSGGVMPNWLVVHDGGALSVGLEQRSAKLALLRRRLFRSPVVLQPRHRELVEWAVRTRPTD